MNVNAIQTNVVCDHCVGNHSSVDCQMGNPFAQSSYGQANYVSNFQCQNNPYSNTYNLEWRNHPNFSWINKSRLNHLSNFHNKRRIRHMRTCSCSKCRRQMWRSKTTQLQSVILRCRTISSQACSQKEL